MKVELDDKAVLSLPAPAKGHKIYWDVAGDRFGCRVTDKGVRSYVVKYRTNAGGERCYTIGAVSHWKCRSARQEAEDIRRKARREGFDPLDVLAHQRQGRREEAAQATVNVLCDRFEELHFPKLRDASVRDYKSIIRLYIRPELGELKVRDVTIAHAERLHRKVSKTAPYRANRMKAVGSKMFAFAARTPAADDIDPPVPMRLDGVNPFRGVEQNPEQKRHRYLSKDEVAALMKALAALEDKQAANIIRLLLLTGCRKGELLSSRWSQFDLVAGVWTKPSAATKQKTLHRVPLSEPARKLLVEIRESQEVAARKKREQLPNDGFVFPGRIGGTHRFEIKGAWLDLAVTAKMVGPAEMRDEHGKPQLGKDGKPLVVLRPTARLHDLRHTYASMLVSSGLSLPVIGALLGHTQPQTTARYSHLMDDPLRAATDRVGALVMPEPEGEPA